ncbi:MAG: hypothetical protein L0Z53_16580, partial [Acidobacteriales bacterium]|nr:hypothetical protein [Terriglobales bacterium]
MGPRVATPLAASQGSLRLGQRRLYPFLTAPPGQTHLTCQQAEQIGMVPAGVELFASNAALLGLL